MGKDRIDYFDCCKGVLIIFVVLGHVMPEATDIHVWIYAWHMPAFFVVNGLLLTYVGFSNRPLLKHGGVIWKGILKLLVPYFAYGGILLFARWANSGFEYSNLRWQLIDLGTFCGIGATWFLPCLFFAQVIYWLVVRASNLLALHKIGSSVFKLAAALMLALIAFYMPDFCFVTFVCYRAAMAASFIIVGDLMFTLIMSFRKFSIPKQWFFTVSLFLAECGIFWLTGKNEGALNVLHFGNPVLYLLNAYLGTVMILAILSALEISPVGAEARNVLKYFGNNSLIVLGTHQVLMLVCRIPVKEGYLWNIFWCIAVLVLEVPVICAITKLRKVKNQWIMRSDKFN